MEGNYKCEIFKLKHLILPIDFLKILHFEFLIG